MMADQAKAHDAAMRTITIMLPVRYNESPDQMLPSSVGHSPSHGPLSGQLLGTLPQNGPVIVGRWSARFDAAPPPGDNDAARLAGSDRDISADNLPPSPISPGFIWHMFTGAGRYPHAARRNWIPTSASELRRQQQARPEQLVQRYVNLAGHRSDTMLKNNMMMTAVAYGLLGDGGDSQLSADTTTSSIARTTTAATVGANRKGKSSNYPHRYRSHTGGRRPVRRREKFEISVDSDDDEDEILEALFGYERSPPTFFRRAGRPSLSGARRGGYGRRRVGDGERRRRWRGPGKLRRRPDSDSRNKHSARDATVAPTQQQKKPEAVGSSTESSRRLSLLHIVVSRQQDFAVPPPDVVDHHPIQDARPPVDVDNIRSLSHHPFIQPVPPFLPSRPVIVDTGRLQHDRYQQQKITSFFPRVNFRDPGIFRVPNSKKPLPPPPTRQLRQSSYDNANKAL